MVSPLQRRKMLLAQGVSSPIAATSKVKVSTWDLVRSTLLSDIRSLKKLQSITAKIEYKRKIIVNYKEFFSAADMPSDIKVRLMIWCFDVDDIDVACRFAFECIDNGCAMPGEFASTLENFVADEIYNFCAKAFKAGQSIEPYFTQAFNLVQSIDTFDEIKAKYLKLAGAVCIGTASTQIKHVASADDLRSAKSFFETAAEVYPKAGVKTRLDEINKRLAHLESSTP